MQEMMSKEFQKRGKDVKREREISKIMCMERKGKKREKEKKKRKEEREREREREREETQERYEEG
jgi:hypothetical protein